MKTLYALFGLAMVANPVMADDVFSENENFINSLNSFTANAPYIAVDNTVILDDPTKSGKPVYILAGSPQIDFGGRIGYLPMASIVLVGKSCADCTVTMHRYSTGGEFDHFIIEFSTP